MRIGFHVSISGGLLKALERAERLHCQTMQIFSRNPRGWQLNKVKKEEIEEFKEKRKKKEIYPLFVHTPYLINLASPEKIIWKKSINFFVEDLHFSEIIGADYLITHLGSHKGKGEDFGERRFAEGLNRAIERAETKIGILLENTAGQGRSLGYNFFQIKRIRDKIIKKEIIGLCFDTSHAFSAGYKINTQEGLGDTLRELESLGLWKGFILVHLNDSKTDLGERLDRHEHIGEGKIGKEGFKVILNHPYLKALSFIMETPRKSDRDDFKNLRTVLSLIF
ncbi:MAG: deoxyribonuclease IV [Candidatus Omnitrophica bacterium]|nr:deoxyribonuclease IV [Candidatus Omnitrophota bacterium]MCM8794098.1 deoxyribonuclease IV [Candidatus Omnitrophota bacterium]